MAHLHYIDEIPHEHIMRLGNLNQAMHIIQKRQNGKHTHNQLQIAKEAQIFIGSTTTSCIIMHLCNQSSILLHHIFHQKQHVDPSCLHIFQQFFFFNCEHIKQLLEFQMFFGGWKKKAYNTWNKVSKWATKLNFDKTNTTRLVQWAKQCMPSIKGATLSFICVVTLAHAPCNTLLPSHPIDVSFTPNFSIVTPPNLNMANKHQTKTHFVLSPTH